ncbi:MAG: dienelactone hydrolase family protein [Alphaproteobacteria bacterium]|nr:dienelactone hydrolase family protein [Alphaproteobacteria bacterium]
MSDFFTLQGPSFGPAAGGRPRSLVILLHGLGADGDDLIQLAPYWADRLPTTEFLSPHAPFPCDMAPYGRQWFSLQDRDPKAVLAGVEAAAPILDAFIDASLEARGLDDSALALVGFSQGTMMSLFVAPRRKSPIAGVVGFSGALIAGERLAAECRARPPVLLVHGEADPIVPFAAMAAAESALRMAGLEVATEARPGLPHSIDEVGLAKGGSFLATRLPR